MDAQTENDSSGGEFVDLVLVGGGHAHVHVIKMLGTPRYRQWRETHKIRVTLLARDLRTPYSGMLPGYVAGHYSLEEMHVNLQRLCRFANVRLVHASATGIVLFNHDTENCSSTDNSSSRTAKGHVECSEGQPPVRFHVLSLDIGSMPSQTPPKYAIPVKPISQFAQQYQGLQETIRQYSHKKFVLSVVGGGAGGIELALAAHYQLQQQPSNSCQVQVILVTRGPALLETHNRSVRRKLERILNERNIPIRYQAEVIGVEEYQDENNNRRRKRLVLSPQSQPQPPIVCDECLWCTTAGAATWLETTSLATSAAGFVQVNDTFESTNTPGVFAAGDCCDMVPRALPKAGVFAVRAGPILLENLVRSLTCRPSLQRYLPQRHFLALISTGNAYAIASRGSYFCWEGKLVWKWKDYLDRSWMKQYTFDE